MTLHMITEYQGYITAAYALVLSAVFIMSLRTFVRRSRIKSKDFLRNYTD